MALNCQQLKTDLIALKDLKVQLDAAFEAEKGKTKRDFSEAWRIKKQMQMLIEEIEKKLDVREVRATIKRESDANFGKEVVLNFENELKYWRTFYQEKGIDWVSLPDEIKITEEQAKEMKRMIEELGFNKMIIIPADLVGEPEVEEVGGKKVLTKPAEHYEELHRKMSKGYKKTYQGDNYQKDGGLGGSRDKRTGLRIILTKEIQNLIDDELFKETIGKSVDDLETEDGIFQKYGAEGLTESEYLIYQMDYFKREKKHLDEQGWTWLPESGRPASAEATAGKPLFGRVPSGGWSPLVGRLAFNSAIADYRSVILGCRLAGSFVLEVA